MKSLSTRRQFMEQAALAGAVALAAPFPASFAQTSHSSRKWKLALTPGSIGVRAGSRECTALAVKYGFEAVEPGAQFLAGLSEQALAEFLAEMKGKGLAFAAAGLPLDFRGDEAKFKSGLDALPPLAAALQRAGVDRVGTWLSPAHNDLTYLENFRQHARRLRAAAQVLKDHGQRLGLEYVGPPTSRLGKRFAFIHTMRETQELISEIGTGNVGFVLDSWHWWTAGETDAEILSIKGTDVVSVDLNDAPAGIPVDQQKDGKRELPCATGVIPMASFLKALNQIGYDGPARAEPFNKTVNDLDDEPACAAVIASLRQAVALM